MLLKKLTKFLLYITIYIYYVWFPVSINCHSWENGENFFEAAPINGHKWDTTLSGIQNDGKQFVHHGDGGDIYYL